MVVRILRWSFYRLVGRPARNAFRRALRLARTVFVLGVLVAIGIALWRRLSSDDRPPASEGAEGRRPGEGAVDGAIADTAPTVPATVDPVEGECPVSHPVKATSGSDVFHVPGGAFYDRTHADVCYRDAAAAQADGLRPSKR